jgi:hypothetical protein
MPDRTTESSEPYNIDVQHVDFGFVDRNNHNAGYIITTSEVDLVPATADREEEKGRSFSGQEIYGQAPNPPSSAMFWADDIAAQLLHLNRMQSLTALFAKATSLGFDKSPEDFGALLGCQAAGHGISWADDLAPGSYDQIDVPSREFYV